MAGGQHGAWRAGAIVLKQVTDVTEASWCAEVLAAVTTDSRFRVARPLAAASGWIVAGWSAWRWLPGRSADWRLHEIAAAGEAFHQAIRDVPRPDFIDRRDDPWSHGDRIAWEEEQLPDTGPWLPELRQLASMRTTVSAESRLMHPDLAGNVLFEPGRPPAVIDWPPYWRPAAWAAAIAAVDGLDTGRVTLADATGLSEGPQWAQLLVRAELYRLGTKNHAAVHGRPLADDKVHHRRTVGWLHQLAEAAARERPG